MSRVFVATEVTLDRQVVVKVLPPALAAGPTVERFRREIQRTAKLQHPHIVPLLSAGAAEGLLYYTMPLIEGESLRAKLVRQGELPIPEAVRILLDVADALAYAHEHGLVHRDIKPDNVLISGKHAVVTDFGVSKALSAATGKATLTSIGVALGTPAYMAPEQAAADPSTDHRADIYALGVVAYEVLTGHPPFSGLSAQQVLAAHVTEPVTPVRRCRATVPPALETLVMHCLEKHAADRPQTAGEVLRALEAMATPSGGTTPTAGAPATPRTRRRWPAMATGSALLVLAGIAALRLQHRGASVDAKRVSVSAFINKTGDATLDPVGPMASDLITRGLSETGVVEIVGAGAGTVIAGSFYRQGDSLAFTADVTDASAGKVLAKIGPETAPRDAPLRGIEKVQARAMGGIAMMFDESYGLQGITFRVAPRYDAYREFATGEEAFYRNQVDSAAAHYNRAVLLDPTFVYPLLRMVYAYSGAHRYVQCDSILAIVSSRRETLSPFESAVLDDAAALSRGDLASSYRATQEMARVAPKSDYAKYGLAESAGESGHWREAVAILEHLDPENGMLRGRIFYYDYLTIALHLVGEHQRELAAAERGRRRYPDRLSVRLLEVRALAALGRAQDVDARISESLALPSSPDGSPAAVIP